MPTGGVCWERARVVYKNDFSVFAKSTVVRFVGRDTDNDGIVTENVAMSYSGRVREAQADLTATGIAAEHVERTSEVSVILR